MPEKNVICVVLAAVRSGGRILLLKRNKEPLKGYWGLVGGKLKAEESIEEACVREIKEETGIDSEFVAIRGVLHERLYEKQNHKYGLMLIFAEAAPKTFEITNSHEGEVKWFFLKDIEKEKIVLSDVWMIKNLLEEKPKLYKVIMKEEDGKLKGMDVHL